MSDPDKITIRPEDLDASVSKPDSEEPSSSRSEYSLPPVVWFVVTLMPFLNAWIWWRCAPQATPGRNLFRVVAFLLGGLSCIGVVIVILVSANLTPRNSWVERIATRANRSVVVIESFPDSKGTGFVVASNGDQHLLLTNRHVITTPKQCRAVMRTGEKFLAEVVAFAKDEEVDLVLLRVQAGGLRPLGPIARFSEARQGEPVVAIGHPLNLDYTVTTGIVSAKRRGLELQTSAPISRGNSGGPLINEKGYILGVNTRIVDPSEAESLGFAIRADLVLDEEQWTYSDDVRDLVKRIER